QVDLDNLPEAVQRERAAVLAHDADPVADAGAVDRDDERPVRDRLLDRRLDLLLIGHVGRHETGTRTELVRDRLPVTARQVNDDDMRALRAQPPHGRETQAGRTAGDESGLAADIHEMSVSLEGPPASAGARRRPAAGGRSEALASEARAPAARPSPPQTHVNQQGNI